jgi:hypothetical protein
MPAATSDPHAGGHYRQRMIPRWHARAAGLAALSLSTVQPAAADGWAAPDGAGVLLLAAVRRYARAHARRLSCP